jgi:hypothetical protein
MDRRRLLIVLPTLGLAACAGLFAPRKISVERRDIERWLERSFPLERRLLEVLDVTLSTPTLQLLPQSNRIATTLDVAALDRLFGGLWRGRLSLESALRWERGDASLRLAHVDVRAFRLDGDGRAVATPAERLGAVVAERVLEDLSVWRLAPDRAEMLRRAGLEPGPPTVTASGVELELVPTAR